MSVPTLREELKFAKVKEFGHGRRHETEENKHQRRVGTRNKNGTEICKSENQEHGIEIEELTSKSLSSKYALQQLYDSSPSRMEQ